MRRGAGIGALAALVVALGTLLLFGASASAKMAQTITFASTPPSGAVAGDSYTASATETSGMRVSFQAGGACAFKTGPRENEEERLEAEFAEEGAVQRPQSPTTVYFIGAGTCTIGAIGSGDAEYESPPEVWESFSVARNPSEQITFTSEPPSNATVGGSYNPVVRLSAGIRVSFFTTTPSVCRIAPAHAAVSFVGGGTCTIGVRQNGVSESEPLEAEQSFTVSRALLPSDLQTPTSSKKAPTKAKRSVKKRKTSAKSPIPAKLRAGLLRTARSYAFISKERHPYDIRAVLTTNEAARSLAGRGTKGGDEAVYLIAMRGSFHLHCFGHPCPVSGPVMEIEVLISAGHVGFYGITEQYPNLESLGTPVPLGPVKAHMAPTKHA